MADPKTPNPNTRPMINGGFPKPPFWLTSAIVIGLCASLLLVATLLRSRFSHSREPRVHYIQDMDNQVKVKTQHASSVFDDGRATRPKIPGTVSRNNFANDAHMANGFTRTYDPVAKKWNEPVFDTGFPAGVTVDADFLKLGQRKFNTYCMPCHGYDGQGNGPVHYRSQELQSNGVAGMSWVQPSVLTDPVRVGRPDGHIYNSITNGIRNMGGYGWALPDPRERWAIVAYVRALQVSATGLKPPATQPVAMK
ncbi:MAG TPA: cytochrome c [Tepidisphaeraceae bacterium]|jgi:mono/diheme cytochrome c family protein